jgi:hypothetical protein
MGIISEFMSASDAKCKEILDLLYQELEQMDKEQEHDNAYHGQRQQEQL